MLIGGAAGGLWGNPRLTLDADVTIWVEEAKFEATVTALLEHMAARTERPLSFAREPRVLPVTISNGLPADITFGQLPFEEAAIHRASVITVAGYPVKVCSVSDLILHKVISDRPKDQEDIRFLIARFHETLDRTTLTKEVSSLASLLAQPEILSRFLDAWH